MNASQVLTYQASVHSVSRNWVKTFYLYMYIRGTHCINELRYRHFTSTAVVRTVSTSSGTDILFTHPWYTLYQQPRYRHFTNSSMVHTVIISSDTDILLTQLWDIINQRAPVQTFYLLSRGTHCINELRYRHFTYIAVVHIVLKSSGTDILPTQPWNTFY